MKLVLVRLPTELELVELLGLLRGVGHLEKVLQVRIVIHKATLHCRDTLSSVNLMLLISGAILCSQVVFIDYACLVFILILPLDGVILLIFKKVRG